MYIVLKTVLNKSGATLYDSIVIMTSTQGHVRQTIYIWKYVRFQHTPENLFPNAMLYAMTTGDPKHIRKQMCNTSKSFPTYPQ